MTGRISIKFVLGSWMTSETVFLVSWIFIFIFLSPNEWMVRIVWRQFVKWLPITLYLRCLHTMFIFFCQKTGEFCVAVLPTWKNGYEKSEVYNIFKKMMLGWVEFEEISRNCRVKKLRSSRFARTEHQKTLKIIIQKKNWRIFLIFCIAAPSNFELGKFYPRQFLLISSTTAQIYIFFPKLSTLYFL